MAQVIFSVTTAFVSIMEQSAGQGEGFNALTVVMDTTKKPSLIHLHAALQGAVWCTQQFSGISLLCTADLQSTACSPWRMSGTAKIRGMDGQGVEYLGKLRG